MRNTLWIFLILLTGCAPLVTMEPPTLPEVVAFQITPALRIYQDQINQCASEHPEIALTLEERPASALVFGRDTLTLSLASPSLEVTDYAVLLGTEEIVIIGGESNPLDELEAADLASLFTAPEPEFKIWTYPRGNELRQIFEQEMLNGKETSPAALIAANPDVMLNALQDDPMAVGYLPRSWVNGSTQPIHPIAVRDQQINVPILAIAEEEPEGVMRVVLACLQEKIDE